MFWFFNKKKEVEQLKDDTRKGFEAVKKDIQGVGGWIRHLDSEKEMQKRELQELKMELSSLKNELKEEIEGVKNILSFMNGPENRGAFKTAKPVLNKQTSVYPVQTVVQTPVQTPNLDQFSVSERAILWVLLNAELKLSYDDLAAVLGKERATIRGQINAIKQKSEDILKESVEKNGKKRVYIPEEMKEILLKKAKVSFKRRKKDKENSKKQESESSGE